MVLDIEIRTDKVISGRRPDIVVIDKIKRTTTIHTTASYYNTVPLDWKVKDKEGEKIVKYRDLRLEIQKLWNTKADVTPIRMGSLGAI